MRVLFSLVLCAGLAFGGFSALKVMPGCREAGLGNTGVASASGAHGIAWNPAAAAQVSDFSADVSYAKWLLDSHQQSLFLVRNLKVLNAGLGVVGLTAGNFEHRNEVPTEEPLGLFRPTEYAFSLNLSRSFGRWVDAGVTGRYYYSKVLEDAAHGPGVDLGVRVYPLNGLVVGASLVDFGKNLAYVRESYRLPTRARAGISYSQCLGGRLHANAELQGSYFVYTGTPNVHAGLEVGWSETVSVRAGCEWLGERLRPGFGVGLAFGTFRFDYALTLLNDDLGQAHRVAVGLGG